MNAKVDWVKNNPEEAVKTIDDLLLKLEIVTKKEKQIVMLRKALEQINKLDYAGSLWMLDLRSITEDALNNTKE